MPLREAVTGSPENPLGTLAAPSPLDALGREGMSLEEHFRRDHFDTPEVEFPHEWRIQVAGLVARPREVHLAELAAHPVDSQLVVLECAGHRRREYVPLPDGLPWGVGAVGEVEWTGVPLAALLEAAGGVVSGARQVVLHGLDRGEVPSGGVESFARALPLEKARHPDTLVALRCNGRPLPVHRGGPVRAIVPGWYATDSVKWLTRIEVISGDFDGWFEAHDYRLRPPGAPGPGQRLGRLPVHSLLVSPREAETVHSRRVELRGVAWGGSGGPASAWVRANEGPWIPAGLERPRGRYARRFFRAVLQLESGVHTLSCRVRDGAGATQPDEPPPNHDGYANNAVHRVRVEVGGG